MSAYSILTQTQNPDIHFESNYHKNFRFGLSLAPRLELTVLRDWKLWEAREWCAQPQETQGDGALLQGQRERQAGRQAG